MLIKTDPDTIKSYFEDSSNLKGGHADAVVFPKNREELAAFLKEANSKKTPVSVSGGGTNTTGSRIPFGGIVISMEKLDRIIELSKPGSYSKVQAGVTVEDFKEACEKESLFYPCHPTEKTAFVGGTVATNASGSRSFKYGPTRKYVKALEMVLADGSILSVKRGERFLKRGDSTVTLADGRRIQIPIPTYKMPDVKTSAGYFAKDGMDLIDLFIGQEGTLSVITEIEFALVKKPERILSCFVFFKKELDAWGFAGDLKKDRSLDVLSVEYFDSGAVDVLRLKSGNVPAGARAAIFFEQESAGDDDDKAIGSWEGLISKNGGSLDDTWFAMTEKEAEDFTKFRYAIPEAINDMVRASGFRKLSTDIAVPGTKFLEMMDFYSGTFGQNKLNHVIFGHIGENHVHVNILPKSEGELNEGQEACLKFARKAVSLGGTVSAEHGIGKTRHEYLEEMYGKSGVMEMVKIKKALDPDCILGLDNIFPREALR